MSVASSQFAPTPVSSLREAASTRSYNSSRSASTAGSQKSFLESVISDLVKFVCKPFVKFGRLVVSVARSFFILSFVAHTTCGIQSRKEGKIRRIDPEQFGSEYADGVRCGERLIQDDFNEMRRSLEEEKRYAQHIENELGRSRSSPALSAREIREKKQAEKRMFGRP
jgi:hypothetical protein